MHTTTAFVCAMDKSEEYRQSAAYCRKMAEQSRSADIKNNWLLLAEKWLAMLPQAAEHVAEIAN